MTEHYYSEKPQVESQLRTIEVDVRGVHLKLTTDNGVFSKGGLDDATRRLLETVELDASEQVVDLGAGYGVVTAVLGTVFPNTRWTLIDINGRALDLARRNTASFAHRCTYVQSDGIPDGVASTFDDVVLNPPIRAGKTVVYRLFSDAHRVLVPGGRLWIVIQKKHGAPTALEELQRTFDRVDTVYKKSGYFIFRAVKGQN
ncbi:class I SAM-dependent methyltransferase [Alicyclobacillus fastidiosus]|uniref:Methyltransferase n=1 Tax=Alicyclobacillus fastidiosus TaxID=392011 RepID=A0ABV5AIY2_9BACL|nr:methyltransferase [Alicyclobacillus fastidiosus]WEH09985.1 methyltransferase [Alicyclobacillus fastidiosus]